MFDFDTAIYYLTIAVAVFAALLAALWLSLIIWSFRDMRRRTRDPFAQILAALVVAALPIFGLIIYMILRPPETLSEAYERALEEEALLQEIEERPSCPGCSRIVQSDWVVCPHCHTYLKKGCPNCERPIELHWAICPYCAAPQQEAEETEAISETKEDAEVVYSPLFDEDPQAADPI